jgi:hypothetical protein
MRRLDLMGAKMAIVIPTERSESQDPILPAAASNH